MYINPFVAGVIATLFAEAVGFIVYGVSSVILGKKHTKREENEQSETENAER